MSNKVSALVYSRKIGSPIRKAVLVYFAARASDDGAGVWASKSTIAFDIECGRSTVIRTINEFVAEGILRIVGSRKHRNGETTEYAMNLSAIAKLDPSKVSNNQSQDDTSPTAEPVPERDQSRSGTPPVPERDGYQSQSGTQTINRTIKEPPKTVRPKRFQEFWDAFPHRHGAKKGRKECLEKYAVALRKVGDEQILIDAALAYRRDAAVARGYGKGPIPWLSGERWNDEIETASNVTNFPSRADEDVKRWASY